MSLLTSVEKKHINTYLPYQHFELMKRWFSITCCSKVAIKAQCFIVRFFFFKKWDRRYDIKLNTGIILCMRPASQRRRYNVIASSVIGWAHAQNDLWKHKLPFIHAWIEIWRIAWYRQFKHSSYSLKITPFNKRKLHWQSSYNVTTTNLGRDFIIIPSTRSICNAWCIPAKVTLDISGSNGLPEISRVTLTALFDVVSLEFREHFL